MKKYIFIIALFLNFMSSYGQSAKKLMWSAGPGAYLAYNANDPNNSAPPAGAVVFHGHMPFSGKENSVFAVGTHLALSYQYNNQNNYVTKASAANVPVCVEYHLGHNATAEATNRFGLYIGAGYNYYYSKITADGESISGSLDGPIGVFGLKGKIFGRSTAWNFAVTKARQANDYYLASFGWSYCFKPSEVSRRGGASRGYRVPRTRSYGSRGRSFGFLRRRNYVPEY
jgi:hypothetical protein